MLPLYPLYIVHTANFETEPSEYIFRVERRVEKGSKKGGKRRKRRPLWDSNPEISSYNLHALTITLTPETGALTITLSGLLEP